MLSIQKVHLYVSTISKYIFPDFYNIVILWMQIKKPKHSLDF